MNLKIKVLTREAWLKSNKQRRENIAKVVGLTVSHLDRIIKIEESVTIQELMKRNTVIDSTKKVKNAPNTRRNTDIKTSKDKVIHIIHVVDTSTSMMWGRLTNAKLAIKQEVNELAKVKGVTYRYSIVQFDSYVKTIVTNIPFDKDIINGYVDELRCNGLTKLMDGTIRGIELAINGIQNLVKVFTDGEENDSSISRIKFSNKVNNLPDNVTLTFIGPKQAVNFLEQLGADSSNTLVYDGTSEDMSKKMKMSTRATVNYSTKVSLGADSSELKNGFYKGFKK